MMLLGSLPTLIPSLASPCASPLLASPEFRCPSCLENWARLTTWQQRALEKRAFLFPLPPHYKVQGRTLIGQACFICAL